MTSNLFSQLAMVLADTDMQLDEATERAIAEQLVNFELISTALAYHGIKEVPGTASSPTISAWITKWAKLAKVKVSTNDDQTAWCSIFVNEIADACGCETTSKINARSWLDVGKEIPLEEARLGDVVILWRGSPTGWQGHVGFFIRKGPGVIWLLGGNQSNAVNIMSFTDKQFLGVRRLKKMS